MKNLHSFSTLLFVGLFAFMATNVCAQNRNSLGLQPRNQTGALSGTTPGGVGAGGQTGIGRRQLGLSQPGQLGQAGGLGQRGQAGLGGQGPGFGQQPPVGGQDGFVGSDAQQIRNQRSDRRNQRRALFDFAIDSLNEMRESRRERRAQRNQKPPVRVQLRPLFTAPQPSSAELTQASTQLSRALPATAGAAPRVSINGSVATIQGAVKSDYDRRLAAKMLSLQPGISQVENQLTIEQDQAGLLLVPPQ